MDDIEALRAQLAEEKAAAEQLELALKKGKGKIGAVAMTALRHFTYVPPMGYVSTTGFISPPPPSPLSPPPPSL